jgi:HEAT repeat protein
MYVRLWYHHSKKMADKAIIIGINKYRHHPRLRNAVSDATLVYRTLISDYGFARNGVRLLCDQNATRANILRLINDIVPRRWNVRRQDRLFVFFAGHGGRHSNRGKKVWFLVPIDGRPISESSNNWSTVLTSQDIRKLESTFKGAHIFYAFDCCYSGMAFSYQAPPKGPDNLQSVHALVAGRGRETVNDAGGIGHSIFTESLVQALTGWGGLGVASDGAFTASELISFVRRDVPAQIRAKGLHPVQKPFGGPIRGNTEGAEYTFEPVAPRLPASVVTLLFHEYVDIRCQGVRQLGQLPPGDFDDVRLLAFTRLVGDPSPSVRNEVAIQLVESMGKQAVSTLLGMLSDEDEHVLLTVLKVLPGVSRNNPQVIAGLRQLQDNHPPRIRRAIASCLALLGVQSAIRAVIHELPTREGSIRREIIDVLKHLPKGPESKIHITNVIASLLHKEDWRSRRAAAEALGELGLADAVDDLIKLARSASQHYMVRYASVEALGQIGRTAARDVVYRAVLNDRSLLVRTAAAEALGSLDGPSASGSLTRALSQDPEWRVRRAAAESCGLLRDGAATSSLVLAAGDSHFRVRMAVAEALGEIGDGTGRVALQSLVDNDQSQFVKNTAARAIGRL